MAIKLLKYIHQGRSLQHPYLNKQTKINGSRNTFITLTFYDIPNMCEFLSTYKNSHFQWNEQHVAIYWLDYCSLAIGSLIGIHKVSQADWLLNPESSCISLPICLKIWVLGSSIFSYKTVLHSLSHFPSLCADHLYFTLSVMSGLICHWLNSEAGSRNIYNPVTKGW